MFSERTRFPEQPNRWTALRRDLERRGERLLDLTVSNPTRAGLDYPGEEIRGALARPEALAYDPDPRGLAAAREAVAADYAADGIALDPESLVLTASTSESYGFLFKLLLDPGDAVLVPRPGYPLFDHLGGLEGVETTPYPLDPHAGWEVDPAGVAAAAPPRARAVVVVSPGNPTGTVLRRGAWDGLQQLCAARGWALIADEVFAAYAAPPADAIPCAAAAAKDALTFSLGGLSKSCGLPQVKLGWIAAGGPGPERREALRRLEWVADAWLSVGGPVQHGAGRLLAAGRTVRAGIRRRLDANRHRLQEAAAGSAARLLPSHGGWYGVLQVPAVRGEEEWVLDLLQRDGVLVHPGYFYEFPREAFLVVSLLPPPEVFEEGCARLFRQVAEAASAVRRSAR